MDWEALPEVYPVYCCLQARLRFIRCIDIMTVCTEMMRSSNGSCSSSSVMPCKPPFALLQDASGLLPLHVLHRGFLALTTSGTRLLIP